MDWCVPTLFCFQNLAEDRLSNWAKQTAALNDLLSPLILPISAWCWQCKQPAMKPNLMAASSSSFAEAVLFLSMWVQVRCRQSRTWSVWSEIYETEEECHVAFREEISSSSGTVFDLSNPEFDRHLCRLSQLKQVFWFTQTNKLGVEITDKYQNTHGTNVSMQSGRVPMKVVLGFRKAGVDRKMDRINKNERFSRLPSKPTDSINPVSYREPLNAI